MTSDRMQLSELLEKAGADDIVRDMIGFVTQRLMELDTTPDQNEELAALGSGTRRARTLPTGDYEFLSAHEDTLGAYWSASLVSPMSRFTDMAAAVAVAEAVLEAVFEPEAGDARARPGTPLAAIQARLEQPVSRRGFFSAMWPTPWPR